MTVATKVAIQLNCKLGGIPWALSIPVSIKFCTYSCLIPLFSLNVSFLFFLLLNRLKPILWFVAMTHTMTPLEKGILLVPLLQALIKVVHVGTRKFLSMLLGHGRSCLISCNWISQVCELEFLTTYKLHAFIVMRLFKSVDVKITLVHNVLFGKIFIKYIELECLLVISFFLNAIFYHSHLYIIGQWMYVLLSKG